MASDGIATQSFSIRDLSTRSVTIFPHSAQVERVLENLDLQPGFNRIEILGFSPTVHEGSIKIDGHGKAVISGMTVESVRNPENFRDVYDSDSDDDLDKPEPRRLPDKPEHLQALEAKVVKTTAELNLLDQDVRIATRNLENLNMLTNAVGREGMPPSEVSERINNYNTLAGKLVRQIQDAQDQKTPLQEELPKLTEERNAAARAYLRDTKELRKSIKRANAAWNRARQERIKVRKEVLEERSKFWPRVVYKVTVSLERPSDSGNWESPTPPAYDKKSAADDADEQASTVSSDNEQVSLSIRYVTSAASWTPAYDVSVDSSTEVGSLVYRAEISNETSEIWKDAHVTLSTSQTSFKGLGEEVPELKPWNIQFARGNYAAASILMSPLEQWNARMPDDNVVDTHKNRNQLFGVRPNEDPEVSEEDDSDPADQLYDEIEPPAPIPAISLPSMAAVPTSLFSAGAAPPPPPAPAAAPLPRGSGGGDGARWRSIGFGGKKDSNREKLETGRIDQQSRSNRESYRKSQSVSKMRSFDDSSQAEPLGSAATPTPLQASEATWEETGLTATWDLSGLRTIAPSSKRQRYRIAMIGLSDLELQHVCVPKLRRAAFLTMKLRNPSSQTILAGNAGLTLDGAFLGTTALKRVAPGQSITVSLGADEGISVEYAPPVEKRNLSSGLIKQDDSSTFKRCVILRHTKSAGNKATLPIKITVRDQIPVCQDERIRLELAKPRGLRAVGDTARAGEEVKDDDRSAGNRGSVSGSSVARSATTRDDVWGRAVAELGKDGSLEWKVRLMPGQKVALPLEYELRFPKGERLASG